MGELLHGGPSHRPISAYEMTEWAALWEIRAWEAEQAAKRRR